MLEQVFHENSQPSEIVYTVQSPPTFGFLQRSPPKDKHRHNTRDQQHLYYVRPLFSTRLQKSETTWGSDVNKPFFCLHPLFQGVSTQSTNSFTQEDLHQGRILYHQQAVGSTNDSVLLEATNGITRVGPLRVDFDIVPMLLPLQVRDVRRGKPINPILYHQVHL